MGSFDTAESQFKSLVADLTQQQGSAATSDREALVAAQDAVSKAEALVVAMDREARTSDPQNQGQLLARVREHKIKLSIIKRDVRRRAGGVTLPTTSPGSPHSSLGSVLDFSEESASEAGQTVDQRDRLLVSHARLGATSDRLGATRQLAVQAEHMGVTILKDLHDQRQSLLRSHDLVHDVDDEISRARHILRVMGAKMSRNKWSIGLIIFLLFAAISIVILAKLRH